MSKVLYARVDDDVHDELARLAEATGISMRAVVNGTLRVALGLPTTTVQDRVHRALLDELQRGGSGESPSPRGE